MNKNFCLLILLFCFSYTFGQDYHKIDSLKKILNTAPPLYGTDADTTRMKVCIELGRLYQKTKPDSAIWWYTLVTDTIFVEKKIDRYRGWALQNSRSLMNIAAILKSQNNFQESIKFFEKALRIAEKIGYKKGSSYCYTTLGTLLLNNGDYSKSTEYYEKAIRIFEELEDKQGYSGCLMNLGIVAKDKGDYAMSIEYYEKALILAEELNDNQIISNCLINMGVIYSDQGDYYNANNCFEKSMKIAEEFQDKPLILHCLINIGNIASFQSDYPKAEEYYNRSLLIAEEINDKQGISFCYGNLGVVFDNQSDYPKALEYYEKSLQIAEEILDKNLILNSLGNIGNVLLDQGNFQKAIEYYEKSLRIAEEIGNKQGISYNNASLGNLYHDQNNYSKAVECYEKSLRIAEELEDNKQISTCLLNIGVVLEDKGDQAEAIKYYEKSLKIKEELNDWAGISTCLMNLGAMTSILGNYSKAIEYYETAMQIGEKIGEKDKLAFNYPNAAKVYIHLNMPEKAEILLFRSQIIIMSLLKENFTILSENEKELYINKTKSILNHIQSFSITHNNLYDSLAGINYNNELIMKGLLLKSTNAMLDVVNSSNNPLVKEAYFLLKQYRDQISSLHGSEENNRDSLIANLETKANDQDRKLVRLSSEFADIQKLFEYKWEDVQKNLKPNEAAIEFVSFTQGDKNDTTVYAALLITPENKQPQSIKLFEENQLQAIVGANSETGFGFINSLYGTNKEVNESLYRIIWKPLEEYLNEVNTIYYAPVGVLNKVSFAALGNENGQFLCDKYNLHQLSTTGKLINQEEKSEIKMTAVVFGGINYNSDSTKIDPDSYLGWKYLPGTLIEKESIEKQFKKNKVDCISYSGKEAKEENFKALFDSIDAPSILHVSTHGFFYPDPELIKNENKNESESEKTEINFRGSEGFGNWMFVNNKNPMMRSGLVFAEANKVWNEDWGRTDNEGVLTAYEVSNMNMRNTDLVVLSACETGLGDIKGSEGVYGLQRAFKMAGVKYIIMSLWQVPDKETVEFMETFYKKLLKIKDARTAFTETQKEMRKKYDPYFWGAFVLIE